MKIKTQKMQKNFVIVKVKVPLRKEINKIFIELKKHASDCFHCCEPLTNDIVI